MRTLRHILLKAVSLAAAVSVMCPAFAEEVWVRIDNPDSAIRAKLPPDAIDYGRFLWVPEHLLPASVRKMNTQIHRVANPSGFPIEGRSIKLDSLPSGPHSGDEAQTPGFHLVQFHGPVRQTWLAELKAHGLRPIQFIAPNSYLVWGRPDQLPSAAARRANPVRFAGRLPAAERSRVLGKNAEPQNHARALIYRPTANDTLAGLRTGGAEIRDFRSAGGDFLVVDLVAARDHFPDLLAINGVLTLQQITQDAGPRGEMANQSVIGLDGANQTLIPGYQDWLDSLGLDGNGVTVSVVDAGIRQTHQDLSGQFLQCQPGPTLPGSCSEANDNHGTHVAGAIAGHGNSGTVSNGFLRGLGMAPGAKLVQQRYPPLLSAGPNGMQPGGMLTIFEESALSGAVLANNSWGPSATPQGYDIPTREVDLITRNALPDAADPAPILPVWSIMNGAGDNPNSVCAPSSLGAPDEAKNILTVGSSKLQTTAGSQRSDLFDISMNSAHGPACDG
ncbi:MAG TPA: S8 family serine peptidase, partial [Wenzhouxiangella sp.]|nr:S8 family serine peptidase [Wenzhouxiangella sp.]